MTLHLVKLAVGMEDFAGFDRRVAARVAQARREGNPLVMRHLTRHTPRRAAQLLDGGSLYWVVKGFICARQRLMAVEPLHDHQGGRCALVLEGILIRTVACPHRPFQGWRYLNPEKAPPDAASGSSVGPLPEALASELEWLGLL